MQDSATSVSGWNATLEHWNEAAFLALNAPENPAPWLVAIAMVFAQWVVLVVPVLLASLWLWGDRSNRSGLLLTLLGSGLAVTFKQIISLFWYHPRPFAVPIGHTLMEHAADNSFPSDHATFFLAIGLGLLVWTRAQWAGLLVLVAAIPMAWARVFLGVHFPLDILGAIPVAAIGTLFTLPIRGSVRHAILPSLAEPLYHRVFSVAIAKGWVRS